MCAREGEKFELEATPIHDGDRSKRKWENGKVNRTHGNSLIKLPLFPMWPVEASCTPVVATLYVSVTFVGHVAILRAMIDNQSMNNGNILGFERVN